MSSNAVSNPKIMLNPSNVVRFMMSFSSIIVFCQKHAYTHRHTRRAEHIHSPMMDMHIRLLNAYGIWRQTHAPKRFVSTLPPNLLASFSNQHAPSMRCKHRFASVWHSGTHDCKFSTIWKLHAIFRMAQARRVLHARDTYPYNIFVHFNANAIIHISITTPSTPKVA